MTLNLEEIKRRAEAATPGNVIAIGDLICVHEVTREYPDGVVRSLLLHGDIDATIGDMIFYSHARTDIPLLVAEVERLERALDRTEVHMTANQVAIDALATKCGKLKSCLDHAMGALRNVRGFGTTRASQEIAKEALAAIEKELSG